MRDPSFVHRFLAPGEPDGSAVVLLHGTGGDESDLMPLPARPSPRASLLGVRGRSAEEGLNRWFRRLDAVTYGQDHVRAEAQPSSDSSAAARRTLGWTPTGRPS